jgi:hypothetical protein
MLPTLLLLLALLKTSSTKLFFTALAISVATIHEMISILHDEHDASDPRKPLDIRCAHPHLVEPEPSLIRPID